MPDVLFIKTSSLGDVIHQFPALTEARKRLPDARFSWVVEAPFAPLVRLHPAVDMAIPIAARAWRTAAFSTNTWSQIASFKRALRTHRFDEVVDTQGLFFKSALIARYVHGRSHGYDAASIRERAASWLYDVRHSVERRQHAIARNRALTGKALGYTPEGPPDYGLDRAHLAGQSAAAPGAPYGVLLHASANRAKEWPDENWQALAKSLGSTFDLIVPYGSPTERERAERIAQASPRARVPGYAPLDQLARTIAGASFAVGVDTGLLHLAAALGVPLVAIFSASEPDLTGPMGAGPIEVLGGKGAPPSLEAVSASLQLILQRL